MLITRSLSASVVDAVESTFDGQHPCRVCKVVSGGRQAEQRSQQEFDLLQKVVDLKFVVFGNAEIPPRLAVGAVRWPGFFESFQSRAEAPPTPPPLS
jgi:hypothetical protein